MRCAGFSLRRVLQVVELAVAERVQARGTGASLFSGLPSAVRVFPSVLRRQQCPLRFEGGVLRRKLILASKVFLCPKKTAGAQVCGSNRYPWFSWEAADVLKRRSLALAHLRCVRCRLPGCAGPNLPSFALPSSLGASCSSLGARGHPTGTCLEAAAKKAP